MSRASPEPRVVFTPSGRRGRFASGTPILQAARELGVDLASICGGRGLCGRCEVLCAEGHFAKHGISSGAAHVSPPGAVEETFARVRRPLAPGRRLGCQARILGDLVIDVPPASQTYRQVVRKEADARPIRLDPPVRLCLVEVPEAAMDGAGSDLTRLLAALREQWNIEARLATPGLLRDLQATLRSGGWSVTAAVCRETDVLALWPGFKPKIYGAAIDVGSTTIAAHLCDLASGEVLASSGAMNPQIRFGEDLMSRVSYVMMHPEGRSDMTREVRAAVDDLLAQTARDGDVATADIVSLAFVCNPIMHHLLLGISPVELGTAPFALAVDEAVELPATDLDLHINPGAVAYVLPCVAGHVGADAAGVVLSERPQATDAVTLLVDIGTNAEILLGNRQRLLACSSPTGPAFEGAQISAGQRAAPGAIERVRIDPETLEPRFRVIGSELWSDEPGFEAALPVQGVTGICGSGIIEAVVEMYLAAIVGADGVIGSAGGARIRRVGRTYGYVLHEAAADIVITQTDVRQIQLAKAALYAGVKLLMDELGTASVDRIALAGAFGSHIDVRYAMALGMIPDCRLDAVSGVGNAAGHGARIALLNQAARTEIEATAREIDKIETAVAENFQAYFVEAMAIPHRSDAFPHLADAFPAWRERRGAASTSPARRRRGRAGRPAGRS